MFNIIAALVNSVQYQETEHTSRKFINRCIVF